VLCGLIAATGASAAEKLNLMTGSTSASSGLYPMKCRHAYVITDLDTFHVTVVDTGTGDNFKGMRGRSCSSAQGSRLQNSHGADGHRIYQGKLFEEPRMLLYGESSGVCGGGHRGERVKASPI
jgi:hypothetical protein